MKLIIIAVMLGGAVGVLAPLATAKAQEKNEGGQQNERGTLTHAPTGHNITGAVGNTTAAEEAMTRRDTPPSGKKDQRGVAECNKIQGVFRRRSCLNQLD